MAWSFDSTTPIYMQIASRVCADIVSGVYKMGEKIPAVRELALEASVNPNTVQRALAYLEDQGILITAGTMGRFVTDNEETVSEARRRIADECVTDFLGKMKSLGIGGRECIDIVTKTVTEDNSNG